MSLHNQSVLVLDANRTPLNWVNWTDAVLYEAKDMVLWSAGEIVFTAHGGKNRFTGEQSVVRVPSILSVDTSEYVKYREPVLTNKNLFRRDLHLCAYCAKQFHDDKLTRDHVVPTSKGGKNTWKNCVTSCKKCNNYKDDNLLDEIGMSLVYLPYVPNNYENLILKNRNIRADQMEFLLKFLPVESRAANLKRN